MKRISAILSLVTLFACTNQTSSVTEAQAPPASKGIQIQEVEEVAKPASPNVVNQAPPMDAIKGKPLPPGHPPIGSPHGSQAVQPMQMKSDGNELPLPETGNASVAELQRGLSHLQQESNKAVFERAFRLVFTTDRTKRGYDEAKGLLDSVLQSEPNHAASYRTLGYVAVNQGFNQELAIKNYQKAVELEPNYAEAHYALAFMHAVGDKAAGAAHFKKAMELGATDDRGIGPQFYPDLVGHPSATPDATP
ncbi:MAG: tetratricopeptide repeat protein [Myxococcales bacterium]|nr:tetratricopeptide repeat protein [Myxococcales bacterium]